MLIDNIGMLTKIYSYADIAYVGGAYRTGLHNTLEPAVYGIPVIIGPHYEKFYEAVELVKKGGIISTGDKSTLSTTMDGLITNASERKKIGQINSDYIKSKTGATLHIIDHIKKAFVINNKSLDTLSNCKTAQDDQNVNSHLKRIV